MVSIGQRKVRVVALVALSTLALGCYKADFQASAQRVVADTARTLPRNTWNPALALAGSDSVDLGVYLGLRYSITDTTTVGLNLAHMSVGILSVGVRQNFIDREHWALAAQLGVSWMNLDWLWVVPSGTHEVLADLDVVSVPLSLIGTFTAIDWLDFTLEARYAHAEVFGTIQGSSGIANATLGTRALEFNPTVRGYVLGRAALSLGFRLPVWAAVPAEGTAYAELSPGVLAGTQSSAWLRVPFETLWAVHFDAEFPVTEHFRIAAGIRHGVLNREVLGWPVVPSLRFEGRF